MLKIIIFLRSWNDCKILSQVENSIINTRGRNPKIITSKKKTLSIQYQTLTNNLIQMQNNQKILFEQFQLGDLILPNKIVMASLTRIRCDKKTGIANEMLAEYYAQRASAGLILSECSAVSNAGNCYLACAATYNQEQMEG